MSSNDGQKTVNEFILEELKAIKLDVKTTCTEIHEVKESLIPLQIDYQTRMNKKAKFFDLKSGIFAGAVVAVIGVIADFLN